jgi:leucine dehydrogenase
MSPFSHPEFDHHEQVLYCHDAATGLRGIIAVHSTALGPAAGGCRMHPYASEEHALTDVLRLSRGMSYKNAMANLPLGGGKCVIIADPSRPDKADLLRAFSRHVQALGGRYWTAIDVGVGPEDADILAENCDYIFARASQYPDGFNPSLFTAFGGFVGIQAVAEHVWNKTDLTGLRVAIQGLGATGRDLARQLHEAGAQLVVADVMDEAVRYVVENFGARAVDPSRIHAQDVDVFAPCAMGAVINDSTLPEIAAKAICGLANTQVAEPHHGAALRGKGIAHVPDLCREWRRHRGGWANDLFDADTRGPEAERSAPARNHSCHSCASGRRKSVKFRCRR